MTFLDKGTHTTVWRSSLDLYITLPKPYPQENVNAQTDGRLTYEYIEKWLRVQVIFQR